MSERWIPQFAYDTRERQGFSIEEVIRHHVDSKAYSASGQIEDVRARCDALTEIVAAMAKGLDPVHQARLAQALGYYAASTGGGN